MSTCTRGACTVLLAALLGFGVTVATGVGGVGAAVVVIEHDRSELFITEPPPCWADRRA